MGFIAGNWFFILVLLVCAGIHLFGHGHGGRGGRGHDDGGD